MHGKKSLSMENTEVFILPSQCVSFPSDREGFSARVPDPVFETCGLTGDVATRAPHCGTVASMSSSSAAEI